MGHKKHHFFPRVKGKRMDWLLYEIPSSLSIDIIEETYGGSFEWLGTWENFGNESVVFSWENDLDRI